MVLGQFSPGKLAPDNSHQGQLPPGRFPSKTIIARPTTIAPGKFPPRTIVLPPDNYTRTIINLQFNRFLFMVQLYNFCYDKNIIMIIVIKHC